MSGAISEETGESGSAAILDGTDILYVARSAKRRLMSIDIGVGTRFPAHCTSPGRALLAHEPEEGLDRSFAEAVLERRRAKTVTDEAALRAILAEVGRAGHALVGEDLETGLRSLAVPCLDRTDHCSCAADVSVSTARLGVEEMPAVLPPSGRRQRDGADWL